MLQWVEALQESPTGLQQFLIADRYFSRCPTLNHFELLHIFIFSMIRSRGKILVPDVANSVLGALVSITGLRSHIILISTFLTLCLNFLLFRLILLTYLYMTCSFIIFCSVLFVGQAVGGGRDRGCRRSHRCSRRHTY